MPQWVERLGFGRIAFGVWSLFAMFMIAAGWFGFEPVVGAIGGAFDRIGLHRGETVQIEQVPRREPAEPPPFIDEPS